MALRRFMAVRGLRSGCATGVRTRGGASVGDFQVQGGDVRAGAAEGVTICVENLPRSCLGNRAAELAEIVAVDPRLRVCFDTNHLLGESHADFLAALGPLIATTHVSDYDFANERHWLPGEGKIDWRALADGLDAIGYADAFNYELDFRGNPKTVARDRELTPEDIVRNAREIEARAPITVHGAGGLPDLPLWP